MCFDFFSLGSFRQSTEVEPASADWHRGVIHASSSRAHSAAVGPPADEQHPNTFMHLFTVAAATWRLSFYSADQAHYNTICSTDLHFCFPFYVMHTKASTVVGLQDITRTVVVVKHFISLQDCRLTYSLGSWIPSQA